MPGIGLKADTFYSCLQEGTGDSSDLGELTARIANETNTSPAPCSTTRDIPGA